MQTQTYLSIRVEINKCDEKGRSNQRFHSPAACCFFAVHAEGPEMSAVLCTDLRPGTTLFRVWFLWESGRVEVEAVL